MVVMTLPRAGRGHQGVDEAAPEEPVVVAGEQLILGVLEPGLEIDQRIETGDRGKHRPELV